MATSSSSNGTVADYMNRLYGFDQVRDITSANVFTDKRSVIQITINDNNVDGELWSKKDFVTIENELADDDGRRVSSVHTTTLAVKSSTVTSPSFDLDTGELENAMVVQGNVPVSVYLDQTPAGLDADIQEALAKQLSFGLDSAAGVMKNCIAAHNVIHSLLLSALVYFRAKIVESGSSLADNKEGKVMAICRIGDTLAEILSLVQEAKKVSCNLTDEGEGGTVIVGEKYIDLTRAKLPAKCNFCNIAGHGPTPIVGQFSDRLQKEYIKRNDDIIKKKRNAVQKGGLTDIFITKSSFAPQANNNIASKAASTAIQHNYTVNTGERSSIECAFKKAKFDSQVGHLMQSYTDSRIRQLQQQHYYEEEKQQETPGQTCVIREERERDESRYEIVRDSEQERNEEESSTDDTTESCAVAPSSETKQKEKVDFISPEQDNTIEIVEVAAKDNREKINLPDENGGKQPSFRIVQRIDAKATPSIVQNLIMERFQDQLAPPQLKTTVETIPALNPGCAKLAKPLPLVTPIVQSSASQRQAPTAVPISESVPVLPPGYAELTTRPLPLVTPINSTQEPATESVPALPPSYSEKMKPLPLLSPIHSPPATVLVGSVLEPSQSETARVASEIRRLEMLGYSPSLPAIRGRDRQNRASMGKTVKQFGPRKRHK